MTEVQDWLSMDRLLSSTEKDVLSEAYSHHSQKKTPNIIEISESLCLELEAGIMAVNGLAKKGLVQPQIMPDPNFRITRLGFETGRELKTNQTSATVLRKAINKKAEIMKTNQELGELILHALRVMRRYEEYGAENENAPSVSAGLLVMQLDTDLCTVDDILFELRDAGYSYSYYDNEGDEYFSLTSEGRAFIRRHSPVKDLAGDMPRHAENPSPPHQSNIQINSFNGTLSSNQSGGIATGDITGSHNTLGNDNIIDNSTINTIIDRVISQIDKTDASADQKNEVKSLLKKLAEHPLAGPIIASIATISTGLLTMGGK